jgi:hypothetical protein
LGTINVPGLWSIPIKGRRTTLVLTRRHRSAIRVADVEPPHGGPAALRPRESPAKQAGAFFMPAERQSLSRGVSAHFRSQDLGLTDWRNDRQFIWSWPRE